MCDSQAHMDKRVIYRDIYKGTLCWDPRGPSASHTPPMGHRGYIFQKLVPAIPLSRQTSWIIQDSGIFCPSPDSVDLHEILLWVCSPNGPGVLGASVGTNVTGA